MKTLFTLITRGALLLLLTLHHPFPTHAQGTAFTYQGRLSVGANPANGSYDLTFSLWNAASGPTQLGGTITNAAVPVSNGLFTVTLDFGNQFPGADRWLEINLRTNGGGAFVPLNPRQQLTATPYAITAGNVTGTVAAGQLSGAVSLANLPTTALVTNGQAGVNLTGTFSGNGNGNFVLSSSPGVGSSPQSVAAADVNGDGKVDLISANLTANTLTVLTKNGSGGFGLASSPGVGSGPISAVAADVNGDGKVDLISANYNANTLSVLTNNGSGGFVLSSSPGVDIGPSSVAAADVNGDSKVDLISANYGAHTLTVLTNNGNGGFVLSSSLGVGINPLSVTAADVNGDGKVDLVNANLNSTTLTVLTNNGSGGFVLSSSPVVGIGNYSVAAADVNGNAKVDLISANYGNNSLLVLTNNGSGGFVLSSSPGVGDGPQSVTAADVSGDGKVDLISANYNASTLTVLTNNGSGGFVLCSSQGVVGNPVSVTAADVDGNGRMDLISANSFASTLSVLFNLPTFTGSFAGDGAALTGLNLANITIGTLPDARLSTNVALLNRSQSFSGANTFGNAANSFTGNGAGLTTLSAANISSGALADARLSSNVPLLNANQIFAGQNTFNNAVNSFTGSGSGLTSLNAGNLTGAVPTGTLTSVPAGNLTGSVPPAALTSVPAGNLAGTVADARLSANVALRAGGNTFNGNQTINGQIRTDSVVGFSQSSSGNFAVDAPFVIGGRVMVLTNGNFGIGTNAPQQKLHVIGNILASGTVTGSSDRNVKEHFSSVNPRDVLEKVSALPITEWNYITDGETLKHIGPMAQDFFSAFKVGLDDKHISMVDADGVALAAIQGLNQKLEEQLKQQRAENAELKQRLEALEKIIRSQKPN